MGMRRSEVLAMRGGKVMEATDVFQGGLGEICAANDASRGWQEKFD